MSGSLTYDAPQQALWRIAFMKVIIPIFAHFFLALGRFLHFSLSPL